MPNNVTTINVSAPSINPQAQRRIFEMSDGKRVVMYRDGTTTVNKIYRQTSSDAGVTWSAQATIFNPAGANQEGVYMVQAGDTIYGLMVSGSSGGSAAVQAFKCVYASGSFVDTLSAAFTLTSTPPQGGANDYSGAADYDSVNSRVHVTLWGINNVSAVGQWLIGFDTTLALKADLFLQGGSGDGNYADIVVDNTTNPPTVWIIGPEGIGSKTSAKLYSYTFNGTAYTAGVSERCFSAATSISMLAVTLDNAQRPDVFLLDNSANIQTRKRTGVNTYSTQTTLVTESCISMTVTNTGNGNADLAIFYTGFASQVNGEVKVLQRTAGAWAASALFAGGATTGWQAPAAVKMLPSTSGRAHVLYIHPTSGTVTLVYDYLQFGAAPSAPINVLPSGNANTSLTPACSCTYKDVNSTDALSKYRVLVTRVSDGAVFWDTAAVSAPGAPTLALAAGTTLGIGLYRYQVTFVTQVDAATTGETVGGTEATVTTTTGNQAVSLSAIPTGPAGTIQRKIYRTAVGGAAGTEKLVATIADNTTTTYSDTTADGSLGAAVPTTSTALIGTAWGGATITDGGTFSVTYAGTALVKDTQYQIQLQFWDTTGNLRGPMNTAVAFRIEDAPAVSITGPTPFAAVPSSGPTVTWSYSQTLSHAQASYRVVIKDAGNVTTIWDSGTVNSAATSVAVPTGTLANGVTYQINATILSVDGL